MTKAQIRQCEEMNRRGETLRAAVAWRWFQDKGGILTLVTGIPESVLKRFIDTGEIDEVSKSILEMMK